MVIKLVGRPVSNLPKVLVRGLTVYSKYQSGTTSELPISLFSRFLVSQEEQLFTRLDGIF